MHKLVLLRHGESTWNRENRFTGWTDVDLSTAGIEEARAAGRLIKAAAFEFDIAYTSLLKRAIRTLWLAPAGVRPRAPGAARDPSLARTPCRTRPYASQ